jgi:hypothetical protein
LFLVGVFVGTRKSPPVWSPAGLVSLKISLAVLDQAMAVRRHGGSMMVVMTVIAVALHLIQR